MPCIFCHLLLFLSQVVVLVQASVLRKLVVTFLYMCDNCQDENRIKVSRLLSLYSTSQ